MKTAMSYDWLSVFLGFAEGFALILSPCILPVLPAILAVSLTDKHHRSFGVMLGFILVFATVAVFARQLIQHVGIDLDVVRHIAFAFLLLLGVILFSTRLSDLFAKVMHRWVSFGFLNRWVNPARADFWSGVILGGVISLVWVPCAGPILASVLVQAAIQKVTWMSFMILIAFGVGVTIPMLSLVFCGQALIQQLNFFKKRAIFLRRAMGVILLLSVSWMIYQEEKTSSAVKTEISIKTANVLQNGLWRPYIAPELIGITHWLNSPPLTLQALKGHVVLLDFWTYSCINCLRTLPYLKAYYQQYHAKGLEIIGIHSPEFAFERDVARVNEAVLRLGIDYPVALDNQFATWQRFKNQYWPAVYLIDQQGRVVYTHFGEGDEAVLEHNIRFLLNAKNTEQAMMMHQLNASSDAITPELYLGYARTTMQANTTLLHDKDARYVFPSDLSLHAWALQGTWRVMRENIRAQHANGQLSVHVRARQVFIVMGALKQAPIEVRVWFNGRALPSIQVSAYTIYRVLDLPDIEQGILTLSPSQAGLELYTVTFGA